MRYATATATATAALAGGYAALAIAAPYIAQMPPGPPVVDAMGIGSVATVGSLAAGLAVLHVAPVVLHAAHHVAFARLALARGVLALALALARALAPPGWRAAAFVAPARCPLRTQAARYRRAARLEGNGYGA